jgi:hypothetical protein
VDPSGQESQFDYMNSLHIYGVNVDPITTYLLRIQGLQLQAKEAIEKHISELEKKIQNNNIFDFFFLVPNFIDLSQTKRLLAGFKLITYDELVELLQRESSDNPFSTENAENAIPIVFGLLGNAPKGISKGSSVKLGKSHLPRTVEEWKVVMQAARNPATPKTIPFEMTDTRWPA